jgi:hypothetical protein
MISNCWLNLQAVTIANLSTACGTQLDPFLMQGQTSLLSSATNWITINQARPTEAAWIKRHRPFKYGSSGLFFLAATNSRWKNIVVFLPTVFLPVVFLPKENVRLLFYRSYSTLDNNYAQIVKKCVCIKNVR